MMSFKEIAKRCKDIGLSGCHTLLVIDFLVAGGSIYDVPQIVNLISDNVMRKVILDRKEFIESAEMIKISPFGGIKTQKTNYRDFKQERLRTKFHNRNFIR
ncbi:hypothetical protein GCM10009120_18550 [Sphingobacterium siyangense subsp. cladoniae]|uniref:hypothetical protein n=1 Tax=Sphingobacterium siyangense TaxID=459529 RepID=UPI0031F8F1FD